MKLLRHLIISSVALLTLMSGAAPAQHDRYNRDNRDNRFEARFGDRNRQIVFGWYNENRRRAPRGFRYRDRLSPEFESRIYPGAYLDRDLRRWAYPVPIGLRRSLPPPPYGYRYMVVGGHVVLVDDGYRVRDFIRLDIRL